MVGSGPISACGEGRAAAGDHAGHKLSVLSLRAVMKRSDFITVVAAAAVWPFAARAQSSTKTPIISYLFPEFASSQNQWTAAFVRRLQELGWIEEVPLKSNIVVLRERSSLFAGPPQALPSRSQAH